MNATHRAWTPAMCTLLAGLLVCLPACWGPTGHPGTVRHLLCDYQAPSYYDEKFEPVPAQELAAFELPAPVPYRLGIGDELLVKVMSTQPVPGYEDGIQAQVKDDGAIRLPTVGKVDARGKTSLELEEALLEPIRRDFVKDAVVNIDVTGFKSRRFFVVGEVGDPGTLPVDGKTTLLQALIEASGTNLATADLEESYVIRKNQAIPFSIRDIAARGHPAGLLVMEENDIVFVPHVKDRTDFVYVFGEVGAPSRVPMDHLGPPGSTGTLTLAGAVAEAGGLNERADVDSITIFRGTWPCPQKYCLDICDLYRHGGEIQLMPGDRIAVGTRGSAEFSDSIGPTIQILSATTSALSLAISVLALTER